uniref:CDT1 Geminin-binding domain-containing protein n=1 Tax=Meloidogyne javanica TaxID=6303 RepID=A0A915M4D3_MELJA
MKTNLCNDYFPRRLRPNFSLSGCVPIPKELKRDHGFAHLPNKFNILMTLFNETEKILQAAHGRDQRKTFDELSANVEKNTKKKFTEKHLAQIVSLYPTAYTLRWERARDRRAIQLGLWELVIQPNLIGNKDLSPFVDSFLASISSLPNTPLLNSPNKFGEEDDKLSNNKWAMPNIGDILTDGAIPSRPKSCGANLQTTDIRMFLKSVKKETKIEREKTPERPNQEQKIEGPPTLFKKLAVSSEPQTPKQCDDSKSLPPMTPIQERLRAKFTANEKAQKGGLSIMEKRRALLNRLDKSILEVIRAHLNLEQRFSVGLSEKSLLQKLGKEITSGIYF